MHKKLIALAVTGALAAPLAAQAAVEVYGVAAISVDHIDNGSKSDLYVSSNESRLGFRANEDLGGGLKAIFSAETTIRLDGTSASKVFDRNTYGGLSGGFGTVMLGYVDSPVKTVGRNVDLFAGQLGDSRNLIKQGLSDNRLGNLVAYMTPDMGGFVGTIGYVAPEGGTDTSAYALSGEFKQGPVYAGVAYQSAEGGLVTPGDESESTLRVGASYAMGDAKILALFQTTSDKDGMEGKDLSVWGLGASLKVGSGTAKAQVYNADVDDKATIDNGAMMYAVGYDYMLSKNTTIYGVYASTSNDDQGIYSMYAGGHTNDAPITAPTAGKDTSGFSVGMVFKF